MPPPPPPLDPADRYIDVLYVTVVVYVPLSFPGDVAIRDTLPSVFPLNVVVAIPLDTVSVDDEMTTLPIPC